MTWLSDTGNPSALASGLLAVVALFAFWGAAIAALTALLGTARPRSRKCVEEPTVLSASIPAGVTGVVETGATAPTQRPRPISMSAR